MSLTNSSLQEMPPRDSKTNFKILRFQTKSNKKEMFSSHPKIVPSSYALMISWIFLMIYKIFYKCWPLHRTCICYLFIGFQCHHCMCCWHTSLEEENERNKWTWLYLEYIYVMDKFGLSRQVLIRDKQNQICDVVLFLYDNQCIIFFS